jgi:hypothetical protein
LAFSLWIGLAASVFKAGRVAHSNRQSISGTVTASFAAAVRASACEVACP